MHEHDNVAIAVRDLGIQYDLRLTSDRTLHRTASELVRLGRNGSEPRFWALGGITFEVASGEVLGVIGRNGSGKTTLLLAIAGILRPDKGLVRTFDARPTLVTMRTPFEPDLTGRRNIYLNGAYLGFSHEAIEAKIDQIIEFCDLGRFIDAPVRTYSSGMRGRLAFSIAAHVDPHILLIDEALAVGDASFLPKSRAKIEQLIDYAHSVVVVSHNMRLMIEMCTRVLWLDKGHIAGFGEPAEIIERYRVATGQRGPLPGITEPVAAPRAAAARSAENAHALFVAALARNLQLPEEVLRQRIDEALRAGDGAAPAPRKAAGVKKTRSGSRRGKPTS